MSLNINKLPKYSFKNEIGNSISHGIGFLFSLSVLIFFIIHNIVNHLSFIEMAPFYFYVLTMMIVFLNSTLYHTSKFNSKYRVIIRIIDHCDIYLFVAGTYLPICLLDIVPHNIGIIMMIVEFLFAIYGILANAIPNNSKFLKISSYLVYVVQGWLLLFFLPFGITYTFNMFLFILIGGVVYTFGAITYAIGKKKPIYHTIFHIFVVVAAIIQFIGIYYLL